MPSHASPAENERDNMINFVQMQRDTFRYIAHGLTDEQARLKPTAGDLSIGGLIKHVAQMERNWIATIEQRTPKPGEIDYTRGFTMLEDETLEGLLADLEACGRESNEILAGYDLADPVPVPDAPWHPKDVDHWSVRWVLAHLIEEMARHAGHGDIIRETIDGKTMYELQAMADGWYEEYLEMMRQYGG